MTPTARPLGQRWRARRRNGVGLLLLLPLALLVALRGDTRDTSLYIDVFQQTLHFPWDPLAYYAEVGMEWGYGIVSWLFGKLGLGTTSLFLAVSLFTFYFLGKAATNVGLTLLEVCPYYLGTFFLLQQLMQIRQGAGSAFALCVVTLVAGSRRPMWRNARDALLAAMLHLTSLLLLGSAVLLRLALPRPSRWRVALWALGIAAAAAIFARLFMSLDLISALGRLSVYAGDEEYSAERGLLAPANIRAALLLVLFLVASPAALLRSRAYVLMTGLYAAHLGFRLGFFDFLILSARLSTALGFVEVLLLPMLVRARWRSSAARTLFAVAYLAVHVAATLSVQAPYLFHDYFTPLQPARTAP